MFKRSQKRGFMIEPEEIFMDSINSLGFDSNRHEGRIEKSLSSASGALVMIFSIGAVAILFARIGFLQIAEGATLYQKSLEQSLVVSSVNPPRGQIIDVNGNLLAGNKTSFDIVAYRSEFLRSGMPLDEWKRNIEDILAVTFDGEVDQDFPESIKEMPNELVIARNIDQQTLLALQENKEKLPGLFPEERYQRMYKGGSASATLLGYVGLPTKDDQDAEYGTLVGKLGLERYYDDALRGEIGKNILQIDAKREVQRIKTVEEAKLGSTLKLSIDQDLQEKAYEILGTYIRGFGKRSGAVVVLDPRSGAVRALVSYPSFDNNIFSKRLSKKDFESIFMNPDKPLYNRAASGEYPPGSTIKPIIASAALEESIIDPSKQIFSPGFIQIPNPFSPGEFSRFLDWKPLGWMDMRNALAFSSNVYFYSIGGGYGSQQGLGVDRIKKYEQLFGLGSLLGVDFPNARPGFVPDPIWKAEKREKDPIWRVGDTYNISIGQGDTLVTPLHVAAYTAVFANKGTLYRPYILDAIIDPDTKAVVQKTEPAILRKDFLSDSTIDIVREGMRMVVTVGTARILQAVPVSVAGKTGTAQTGRLNEEHAWFTAFAPYENAEVVVTVLVEKGGEGSSISAPIAKEILQWYFRKAGAPPETTSGGGDN